MPKREAEARMGARAPWRRGGGGEPAEGTRPFDDEHEGV